jgi:hypothetical protein
MILPIKHNPQNPVLISLNRDWRFKIPRMWLVMWFIPDRNATKRTSGDVFTRFMIIDRVRAILVPRFDLVVVAEPLAKRLQPSWLPMVASASANARDCSKSVIPVSAATGRPCTAQEIVSTK